MLRVVVTVRVEGQDNTQMHTAEKAWPHWDTRDLALGPCLAECLYAVFLGDPEAMLTIARAVDDLDAMLQSPDPDGVEYDPVAEAVHRDAFSEAAGRYVDWWWRKLEEEQSPPPTS